MAISLPSRPFRPSSSTNTIGARYRRSLNRHPFLLFGLPFILTIVGASFLVTPFAAMRYERHDRKVRRMTREEELSLGKGVGKRKVDVKEEYYRLAAKDLDDWEQRRVKRLPGEPDGVL